MGEPATPSPADRLATRKLAAAVLEAIREDEAMPHGMDEFRADGGWEFHREDVESLIAQLCGEIVALKADLRRALSLAEADGVTFAERYGEVVELQQAADILDGDLRWKEKP